ncbi:hypothetical protein VKT23_013811 [Stygiomarasmius scandens]|uniref:CHAT domain-containing protein n=1 Tax=Marasmiellus scandens TaxID=2682957 RepID=A0ABR1J4I5_9AGAR
MSVPTHGKDVTVMEVEQKSSKMLEYVPDENDESDGRTLANLIPVDYGALQMSPSTQLGVNWDDELGKIFRSASGPYYVFNEQFASLRGINLEEVESVMEAKGLIEAAEEAAKAFFNTPTGPAYVPDEHGRITSHRMVAEEKNFQFTDDLTGINNQIINLQTALHLTPDDHADKVKLIARLVAVLNRRFLGLQEPADIDNAICAVQQAIDLTPDSHTIKAGLLSDLGVLYGSRFERLNSHEDLTKGICAIQKAVDLAPDNHTFLSNLGTAFIRRFQHDGKTGGDIDNALLNLQRAVHIIHDIDTAKPEILSNLGNTFMTRFVHFGDLKDLDSGIAALQKAVDLAPDNYNLLMNLAAAFKIRFQYHSKVEDINMSISAYQKTLSVIPGYHPEKVECFTALGYFNGGTLARILIGLGDALMTRYKLQKYHYDLTCGLSAFQQAACQSLGSPSLQLKAAIQWATLCSNHGNISMALQAYKMVLEIIPEVVWLGQKVHHRFKQLPHIGNVINAAAAVAISAQELPTALEWLEEGRSIVWGQILQLRTPLDDLGKKNPELASRLQIVSQALESAGTTGNNWMQNTSLKIQTLAAGLEAPSHRALAAEYRGLISKAREQDGFKGFLQPKKFSELASAAKKGLVVIVNVHESRCDALALCPSQDIIHVPLPAFSSHKANELYSKLISSLKANHVWVDRGEDRIMYAAKSGSTDHFQSVLADLWSLIVQPILSAIEHVLSDVIQDHLPHITWCATGPLSFLPLHAAGIYDPNDLERQINISDFAVSSYTPTLTALLVPSTQLRKGLDSISPPKVLIVSQPQTPQLNPLPGTIKEAEVIQTHTVATHLNHEKATVDNVLKAMTDHNWVHLACHGIQVVNNPLESAFALFDRKLHLELLMATSLENAELAVLSACQTATGDENLPEEAVHLAAGMLSVGYPSVIATMWSIQDEDAPLVADKVYSSLIKDYEAFRKQDMSPTYALHNAVRHLQGEVGKTNFVRWIPFVHFGV